jgi:uncharacterized protein DUF5915
MNRLASPVSQLVWVVPQHFADDLDSPTYLLETREPVHGFGSRHQQLRRDLGFSGSDRIRVWTSAPNQAQVATTDYNSWIANEELARDVSPGESTVDQQARDLDLDGSLARVALSKEL